MNLTYISHPHKNIKIEFGKKCQINALGEQAIVFIDPLQWLPASRAISLDLVDVSSGLLKSDEQ